MFELTSAYWPSKAIHWFQHQPAPENNWNHGSIPSCWIDLAGNCVTNRSTLIHLSGETYLVD